MSSNHVLLETINLTQSAASVTFDNIPQTGYTDLKVVVSSRTVGSSGVTWSPIRATFNGTSTAGLSFRAMYGNGTGASATNSNPSEVAFSASNSNTANTFSNSEFTILNYTSNTEKQIISDSVLETNAVTTLIAVGSTTWANTSAVTSIVLPCPAADGGLFVAGSTFSLYGIAAVGATPAVAPFATGGNIVANDGTYWYHAFLSSGTFTPQKALSCDVLVVGGGGSGGSGHAGGGGGAGGLLGFTSQSLTAINYPIVIGAGGPYAATEGGAGASNGNFSQFGALTAAAGGGAGGNESALASSGGSGGGGAGGGGLISGASVSPSGQGNSGGAGSGTNPTGYGSGGGGGGAGASGSAASGTLNAGGGGAGGAGSSAYSTWGVATSTGQNVSGTRFYAGGGGGGYWGSGDGAGVGGNGGGGKGGWGTSSPNSPTNGTANTGGGGGGGRGDNSVGTPGRQGAAGGSGIVIVRYPMAS